MTENKKAQYLPFHAINEFMRDDFRLTIMQEVLSNINKIDKEKTLRINRHISKGVQIPGFRNSSLAPSGVKARLSTSLFENSPEFAALIIDCWSQFHQALEESVWQVLNNRNWKPFPLEVDRTLLPGFATDWPKGDTFESFRKALQDLQPDLNESEDNISLMVVWVGNKLPYGLYEDPSV